MNQTCLVVDDSLTIRRGLKLTLEREGLFDTILEAQNGREALEVLAGWHATAEGGRLDLVLCDVVMPEMDGFEFVEAFKRDERHVDVPVIMLTGQEAVAKKVRALGVGASDYLTKPFDPAELVARVRVHVKLKTLQDQLREANRRLHALAITDPLTGLYNRRHFMEGLEREVERARRHSTPLAILMVDVDHFKAINDTHGHQIGDRVLVSIARLLEDALRKTDSIGRYGGEEFVVLLPQTGRTEAAAVGEKLREAIDTWDFESADSAPITVSVGVACIPDEGIESLDELIQRADAALYQAKAQGRDRVVMWIGELGCAASVAVQP